MKKKENGFWKFARVSGLYVREIAGWALLILGLSFFFISLQFIRPNSGYAPLVIEGLIAAFMGFVVFRGGLQLVKVSVAARTVRRARTESTDAAQPM